MHPFLKDVSDQLLDTIFPIHCLGCGEEGPLYLCTECIVSLERLRLQNCIMCHKSSLGGITHNKCLTPTSPIQTISLFAYKDTRVSRAIILGKYKFVPAIYAELGHMLALFLKGRPDISKTDFVIPIPLSPQRKRWRGFNQAEIVAAQISINSNIPLSNVLTRNKNTKTQKDLNKKDRMENMKGSFEVSTKANLGDKNVMLIDDVLTTGSTLLEATKALKEAGVASVICVTLARD